MKYQLMDNYSLFYYKFVKDKGSGPLNRENLTLFFEIVHDFGEGVSVHIRTLLSNGYIAFALRGVEGHLRKLVMEFSGCYTSDMLMHVSKEESADEETLIEIYGILVPFGRNSLPENQ